MAAEVTVPTVTPIWLVEEASDRKMEVVVAVNTDVPLNVVVLPMRSISALICVNSASRAPRCAWLTVPVEASVARVTARLRSVVTCARAPSATCKAPTPLLAFCADCVRAVVFAFKPSAIAKPAASSAPELIREPEERRNKVFCKFWLVIDRLFCATNDGMLLRMLSAMCWLLLNFLKLSVGRPGARSARGLNPRVSACSHVATELPTYSQRLSAVLGKALGD